MRKAWILVFEKSEHSLYSDVSTRMGAMFNIGQEPIFSPLPGEFQEN